jgi:hypothetical protein
MANDPNQAQVRLRESAGRGLVPESEMARRAESVSQAAIIVRANEARSLKQQRITMAVVAGVALAIWLFAC